MDGNFDRMVRLFSLVINSGIKTMALKSGKHPFEFWIGFFLAITLE
jgi:hypothetical protein